VPLAPLAWCKEGATRGGARCAKAQSNADALGTVVVTTVMEMEHSRPAYMCVRWATAVAHRVWPRPSRIPTCPPQGPLGRGRLVPPHPRCPPARAPVPARGTPRGRSAFARRMGA